MKNENPWFFEERAVLFAKLVLTKHHEVKVEPDPGATDLRVEILKDSKSTLRFFGVEIVPYMDLPNIKHADESVLWPGPGEPSEVELPICVFVIGIRKPEGIYRWLLEPVVHGGRAVLREGAVSRRDVEASWQTLDEEGADRLIGQVNAWYDARNGGPTARVAGRHSKMGS